MTILTRLEIVTMQVITFKLNTNIPLFVLPLRIYYYFFYILLSVLVSYQSKQQILLFYGKYELDEQEHENLLVVCL